MGLRYFGTLNSPKVLFFREAADVGPRGFQPVSPFSPLSFWSRCYHHSFFFLFGILFNLFSCFCQHPIGASVAFQCLSHMFHFFLSFCQITDYGSRPHYTSFVFHGVINVEIQVLICVGLLPEHSCVDSFVFVNY